ncbi:xanthine dehydrogenase-like [Thrips palmi]|uniref:xanthine dehydrogenase n=1 Tax=Thrips palmi TaxID=161013 RepID=A0A6P9A896_THRPL|nr:xanthine dehydrogenase-like [Thrips palmi]
MEGSKELVFFVNGKKVVDSGVDPEWTLLYYLRNKLRLCGTKLGCAEGGCGACTVMVSRVDRGTGKTRHLAVNACLAPVCAMHGLAVTTVEGIGSTRTRLHPVQERIAKAHGSQCGFCTPGIVMSMYALLRTLPKPSMHDLELAMQGNLCRCTGYRPILEGFRTFTEDYEALQTASRTQGLPNGLANGVANGCPMGKDCCKVNGGNGCGSPANGTVNGTVNGVDALCNGVSNGATNGATNGTANGHAAPAGDRVVNGVPVLADQGGVDAPGAVKQTSTDDKFFSVETFAPYDPSQEPIFPPELKKSAALDEQALCIVGPRVTWFRPTSLQQLVLLKERHPQARIIAGNTEVGVETKFKACLYPVLISSSAVPELQAVAVDAAAEGLRVGAACPLTQVDEALRKLIKELPQHKTRTLQALSSMLRWFAGNQIRNVAGVGGNIMTGSPISDLNPIFLAAGCVLDLRSSRGVRRLRMDQRFFTGYRRNAVLADEVLVSVLLPFTEEAEYLCALKQARRREDDIAIVNLALRLRLRDDGLAIQDAAVAVGGMAPTSVLAQGAAKALAEGSLDSDTLDLACSALAQDLPLPPGAPGGMVRYRQALALSLLVKAFLNIASQTPRSPMLSSRLQSAAEPLTEKPLSSAQYFTTVPGSQARTDFVGKPIVHQSAYKQATGEAVYCDDIRPLDGELYLSPVMSTRAHARVLAVDASAALAVPGVAGVLTAADLPANQNKFGAINLDEEILASGKVLCHGQLVAAVLATEQSVARRAAGLVKVEYQDLPAVLTIEDAIAADSYLVPPAVLAVGDVDKAEAEADHVADGEVRSPGQEHFYLETQAAVAVPGEDGEMEVTASTQSPTGLQDTVARVLGVPKSRVVVRVKRLGGGFGGKEVRAVPFATLCAVAANKYRRPVRFMLDRDEDMATTGQRHPFLTRYKVAFDKEGRLLGLRMHMYTNGGCSEDLTFAVLERAMHHCTNAYYVPSVHLTGYCCKTNLPSNTAFRGFGGPQGILVAETIIRHVANVVGKDPLQVAELNMLRDGHETLYHHRVEECTVRRCWDEMLQQALYRQRLHDVQQFNRQHRYKKRGLAAVPLTYGVAYSVKFLNQAGALVHVYTDGSVLLTHGGTEMGQGLHTKMIQVASRALGVDASNIHISETATDKVPNTSATAASFSSDLNGMAIKQACEKILERLRPFREANPTGRWEDWVRAAYFETVSLSATGYYTTEGINYNFRENTGRAYAYLSHGASCSEVEIDCLTGDHKVLSTDIVMDLGESLNPAIDVGQIEGGFMQGYGNYVLEEPVVAANGALLSRGPGAYKIPGFGDIPAEFNVALLKGSSNRHAIYSSKAVGEPPLLLACSVLFALREAVAAAREEEGLRGWFHLDAPATAATIRLACEDRYTKRFPEPAKGTFTPWNIRV